MDDADSRLALKLIRDFVQIDRALVAKRMESIERVRIALLAAPNEVDPRRQVLADVFTLKSLRRAFERKLVRKRE